MSFGGVPDSWLCVDCGYDTAPGFLAALQLERAYNASAVMHGERLATLEITDQCEVYHVREKTWRRAAMRPDSGCLCIGCLERRIRRRLKPDDFPRNHPFHDLPGTERLRDRRGDWR
jgi:hypothetical protein